MSGLRNFSRISLTSAGPFLFAWGAWLLMAVYLLRFVGTYAIDLPHYDEWEVVPAVTGNQPITLKWLWSQHNEHRIVIGRLLYIAIARLSGSDFRAGMYFNAFALIAAAGLLLERARQLRGVNYTDAFLPLVILNLGQAQNLTWSFQVCFVSAAAMAILVLSLVVARGTLTFPRALVIAACTVALPLAAGPGLGLTPSLVVCSFVMAWELRRAARGWLKAAAVALLGILAVLVSVLYFVDYERPAKHPPSRDWSLVFDAIVQFLLGGFGSGAHALWPRPGEWIFWALTLTTLVALVFVFAQRPSERYRAVRLALFLAALGSLALGIGWARSSFVSLFESRYVTLAAPYWCACYFVWELVGDKVVRQFGQVSLLVLAASLMLPNTTQGNSEALQFRKSRDRVVADIRAGVGIAEIVNRHYGSMYYGGADVLIERMKMLRAKKLAGCGGLPD